MGTVHIVLYILSIVNLIKCGYPPTGDEVVPGSVLLPASRRGRYLANIVRRQAVDGTGIKFNKDADRMNAEAKKKVDVLSEELLPYIIAEQERRTTLHKRVMTAIQNGEKGVTIVEMRNKPPLIIRKGLMYRCPANRAPKEPDGSGVLLCEDDITPTQIMYDACLSAEDKELYNAENKYFFCNRHKIEGPDLPRNGTTVYGCAPIERTSFNYTTSKCSLEDTEDVVVHYRYYPDRTYKYVTELDPDREVCDHWNPCQIGYIFSLPSPDMATPASELWPDAPDTFEDYEKDEIVPPIPEDSIDEYVHPGMQSYTSSPRTIIIPHGGRRSLSFSLEKIQVKTSKGKSRKISQSDFSAKIGAFSITITLSFEEFSPKFFGTFFAIININNKPTPMKFLSLNPSNIEVTAKTIDALHGQKLNSSAIPINCDNCRFHGLMVRAKNNDVYNIPSSRFRVKQMPNRQLTIEINVKDPQPQDFGDYFGLIENSRGQEERHKMLTVRAPENDVENLIKLNRFEVACDVQGNYNNITKYECADCQLTDILCNGQSVLAAGRVTIIPQSQQISYNFPSFADQFSCVYMGFFKVKDTVYKKVVAVIDNNSPTVKIPEVVKIPAPKEDDSLDQEIMFEAENDACDVREIIVNGISLEQSARRSTSAGQAMFQVTQNTINIHIGPFLEAYAGTYQAKFACGEETITKNIMEVTLDEHSGGGGSKDDDTHKSDTDTEDHDSKDGGKNDGGGDGGGGGSGGGGAPAVKIVVEDKSCTLAGECKEEKTYECEACTLKAVKCNDAAADAAKVVIDAENKKIVFDFKEFADTDSCVYMGEFDINGNAHSQPVAVIDNDSKDVTLEKQKKTAKEGEAVEETITFTGEKKTEVAEVRVNGQVVEKKGDKADVPSYEVDEEKKTIKISVPKLSAQYAGHYQVKFKVEEAEVTKTILEVEMEAAGQDGGGAATPSADVKLDISAKTCKVDEKCEVGETSFTCEDCKLSGVKCNGADAAADKVKVEDKKITYTFEKFADTDACVYMGQFEVGGKEHSQPVAVVENDSADITVEVQKKTAKPDEPFSEKITFKTEKDVDVEEVHVNGKVVEKKAEDGFQVDKAGKTITITIPKMTADLAGHYQAKFKDGDATVTKNIMEVTLEAANRRRRRKG